VFELKYDGSRCLAFCDGDHVDLQSKRQKSLNRFFPEVVAGLARLKGRAGAGARRDPGRHFICSNVHGYRALNTLAAPGLAIGIAGYVGFEGMSTQCLPKPLTTSPTIFPVSLWRSTTNAGPIRRSKI
jgi:hypothetical protein